MLDDQVIIIGSAPTGSIAAWILVNAGINVTLLESGNSFPKDVHIRLWNKEICRLYALQARNYIPYPNFENEGDPFTRFTRWGKAYFTDSLRLFDQLKHRKNFRLIHECTCFSVSAAQN